MVKASSLLLAVLPYAAAWPEVMEMNENLLAKRVEPPPRQPASPNTRPNTSTPPAGFDAAAQYVDVTAGSGHEFQSPGTSDLRGQCPGLNAAANHAFLPRNGIASIAQTTTGLGDAFGMSPDLAIFLAVLAIAISGDPVTGTWSIGGGYDGTLQAVLGRPVGIAGTHNQYESDASIVRGDAYLNGGNVGVFQMRSWENFYNMAEEYTFAEAAAQSDYVTRWSIMNNPYYFAAPFAGFVSPAAHNFVINFMSNHSAEAPGGVLNRDVLQQFFSVTGGPGNFVHNRGQERIPENWYRRPSANAYTIPGVFSDLFQNNAMYPGILRIGGNTGKVNTFTGIDTGNLTGGVFNAATLLQGNNAACFALQAASLGFPSNTNVLTGLGKTLIQWVTQQLGPVTSSLGCPQLATFSTAQLNQFPGASFKAEGQSSSGGGLLGGILG